jgi:hypothetical protein
MLAAMANAGARGRTIGDAQLVGREAQLERILANLAAVEMVVDAWSCW